MRRDRPALRSHAWPRRRPFHRSSAQIQITEPPCAPLIGFAPLFLCFLSLSDRSLLFGIFFHVVALDFSLYHGYRADCRDHRLPPSPNHQPPRIFFSRSWPDPSFFIFASQLFFLFFIPHFVGPFISILNMPLYFSYRRFDTRGRSLLDRRVQHLFFYACLSCTGPHSY